MITNIKSEFPILQQTVNGAPLAYLDNAATTQKPKAVINAISDYYLKHNANVHRGVHHLSNLATKEYDSSREAVRKFINAKEASECIFVRGTTEAINLVANSFGDSLNAGDEIIISTMEHHANIIPWQMLCKLKGTVLKVLPITESGELNLDELPKLISNKTKLISIVYASNSLGTINPVETIIQIAKIHNIPVLLDGAQVNMHLPIDVQELDCDFFTISGHKMYGPTGIGVLYGKKKWLEKMPPYQTGGDMILEVSFENTTFNELPFKFEAGTPNISGAVGLKAAIEFINGIGKENIIKHETELLNYATEKVSEIPGVKIIGTAANKIGVVSFTLDKVHPHDIGTIADKHGVAIRAGHHCTMPLMQFLKISATSRMSFAVYNTIEDIDQMVSAIHATKKLFKA